MRIFDAALLTNLLSLQTTRIRHVGNDPHSEKYDPDFWTAEYAFLNKPGEADIPSDLFTTTAPTWTPTPNGRHGCKKPRPCARALGKI
jgi:hypothetical protein